LFCEVPEASVTSVAVPTAGRGPRGFV
jgi:hypothetical protein